MRLHPKGAFSLRQHGTFFWWFFFASREKKNQQSDRDPCLETRDPVIPLVSARHPLRWVPGAFALKSLSASTRASRDANAAATAEAARAAEAAAIISSLRCRGCGGRDR